MATREVTVLISDEYSSDSDLLQTSVLSLREELLEIDGIYDLTPRGINAPAHSKSGAAALVGALTLAVPASMPVLREFRMMLRDWLHRNDGKHARLEVDGRIVDVTGLSDDTLEKLVFHGLPSDGLSSDVDP